ncbi:MAG: succinate dehydrogenase iron-sulfur subunit [Deltaproteobacteria bacterium]|nr:succinate dehydrogenase iron-sulfur subunit [Deltaproteobacteria bacterium]
MKELKPRHVPVRIKRQEHPGAKPYWEEFLVPWQPSLNAILLLHHIRENPVTADGRSVEPVVWESSCLEEVCGACSMRVNGRARQACSALVDQLDWPVTLEPFSKFPVVRDLWVDRSRMFEALKKVKAWIPIDGTYDLGPGPRMAESLRREAYEYSRCMTCGCCLEVCPQVNSRSEFMGAASMAQVVLFNAHPTGAMNAEERLESVMGKGGINDCGNAQNCVRACPKDIPLTRAIADLGRQVTKQGIKDLLRD